MKNTRNSWIWGIVIFAATIAVMILACVPIQYALGLWGVAITELILLGIAFGGMAVMRYTPRETFPVRRPKANQVVGTVIMMFSAMAVNVPLMLIVFYFIPEGFQVTRHISRLTTSLPLPVAWIIMAVLPAACEEALHRGFLLRTFRSIPNKWIVIGLGGLLFGIFHLDPYRFIPTAFLGVVLTYIMVSTGNLLLPIICHMANNTLSVLAGQVRLPETALYEESLQMIQSPAILGIYLIIGAFGVLALRGGAALIGFRDPGAPLAAPEDLLVRRKHMIISWIVTGGIALGMIATGAVLFAANFGDLFNSALANTL